jgi:hypothetical protein
MTTCVVMKELAEGFFLSVLLMHEKDLK